jgi:hypothetical protein
LYDLPHYEACRDFDLKEPRDVLRSSARTADPRAAILALSQAYGVSKPTARALLGGYLKLQNLAVASEDIPEILWLFNQAKREAPSNPAVLCLFLDNPSLGPIDRDEQIRKFLIDWVRDDSHSSDLVFQLVNHNLALGDAPESSALLSRSVVALLMMAFEEDPHVSPERVVAVLNARSHVFSIGDELLLRLTLFRQPGLSSEVREKMLGGLVRTIEENQLPALVPALVKDLEPSTQSLTFRERDFIVAALRQSGETDAALKWQAGPSPQTATGAKRDRKDDSPECQSLHHVLAQYSVKPALHTDAFALKAQKSRCGWAQPLPWSELLSEAMAPKFPEEAFEDLGKSFFVWRLRNESLMQATPPPEPWLDAWTSVRSAAMAQWARDQALLQKMPPASMKSERMSEQVE